MWEISRRRNGEEIEIENICFHDGKKKKNRFENFPQFFFKKRFDFIFSRFSVLLFLLSRLFATFAFAFVVVVVVVVFPPFLNRHF